MMGLRFLFRKFSEAFLAKDTGNKWISAVQIVMSLLLFGLALFIAYLKITRTL